MKPENDLHVDGLVGGRGISRREAARRLFAGIGAGAALPWSVTGHPIWKHFEDEHLMARAETITADGKLHYLNAEQLESLTSFAEAIVPGSSKAKGAEFIDLLLSVDREKHQKEFVNSLETLEAETSKRYGKKFAAISATERNELLTHVSTLPKSDQDHTPLRAAFENVKEWVSGAYYSSEMGMRELGWTPDRVFAEFRGCTHDARHD